MSNGQASVCVQHFVRWLQRPELPHPHAIVALNVCSTAENRRTGTLRTKNPEELPPHESGEPLKILACSIDTEREPHEEEPPAQ